MKTKDFLVEYKGIEEDAHNMHLDNEVQSARANCYQAAKAAIELHKRLAELDREQGIEPWVLEKLTIAADYLKTLNEYMEEQSVKNVDFELQEPDFEAGFAKHLDNREPDVMLYENMSAEEALRDIERRMFEWNKEFLEAKRFDDYDARIEARKMLLKLAKLRATYQKKAEAEKNQDTTLRPVSPMVKMAEGKAVKKSQKIKEVSPPGWGKSVEKMKKHKDIDNPFALAWSMHKKGYKPHNEGEMNETHNMGNSEEYADQIIDSIGYEGVLGNLDGNKIYRAVEEYQKMLDNPADLNVDEVVEIIVDKLDIRHLGEAKTKKHNVKEEASAGASSASAMSAVSTTLGDTIRRPKMSKPKFKNAVKSNTPKVGKGIY